MVEFAAKEITVVVKVKDINTRHLRAMGLSRREIQRAYRERQKAKGPAFLEKEKAGQRQYYVPAAEMPKRKLQERNLNNKLRNRLCRQRKKTHEDRTSRVNETSGYESEASQPPADISDEDDHEYEINFMARAKSLYKWPSQQDRIWLSHDDILCKMQPLVPNSKSQLRLFLLPTADQQIILGIFTCQRSVK